MLIVDDSLTVRMDLQEAFETAGFDVRSCGTMAAAQALLEQRRADVLVLDVLLPDGDGIELLKDVRAQASQASAVVLMLSTEAEVEARVRGLRTGADEYVGKPYDTGYVVAKARELLRLQRIEADAERRIGPTTILVIDDSPTFREALRDALEQAGYAVAMAGTGEEGLRAAASVRPGAVVVDSVLPGIDGATVIRRLRLDAALRGVPCMLLTAQSDRDAELQALEAGADLFVRKEEDTQVILARLAVALRSAAASAASHTASLLGPKKVLAVDDSATWLAELAATLRAEGYDVVSARSGEEALELVAVQAMDCILLDLMMPGLGGRETCRRIKAMPATRDIPLILLTAMEDRGAMLEGLDAGADDYIQKSAEFEVLKARVRAQIRRKQFEDESRRVRAELANAELEAAHARSAQALAESRAGLLAQLEQKNRVLEATNAELQARQFEIAQTNLELTAASKAKSEFLSTMSHELRTPLNAIIGFSDLLRDGLAGTLTPQQQEFVNYIRDGGGHLLELINEILDLSKIEAGRVEIDPEPVDLDTLLREALTVVGERARAHGVCLETHGLGTSQPLNVDRRRLKQIIYNLLSNAVKFTPDGGNVSVHASLVDRRQASSGLPGFSAGMRLALPDNLYQSFVQICVSDSGVGIARGDMDRLFTAFSQIKNPLSRTIEGTGLGLVTVARLAQLHGGTVAVTSEPGRGSCFTLWLPWQVDAVVTAAPPTLDKPMALVVEDDSTATELMRIQLEAAGFEVQHSASAEAAMQMASNCTPDLITLDIRLPGMDGWSFLSAIKSVPKWADIPVVVVSFVANREVGLSLGAAGVMQKPVNRHEFIRELDLLGFKPTPARQVTVLVVDDDPSAVELMTAYLSQPGYQTLRAFGGQEGIDLAMRHLPDLVVLDLLMPDIGGIEVVEALKLNPQTAEIPVIIVTAKEFSDEDRMQLSEHVLSVVSKADLSGRRFISEVRRACGKALPVNSPG
ncbi:MAG TPA: response regulator [Burkholderiaceae bacterium]|nr:response regulator [Burkholderiaceae bacterium]